MKGRAPRRWPLAALGLLLCLGGATCWGGGSGKITTLDDRTVVGDLSDGDFRILCTQIDGWNDAQFGSAEFRRQHCEIDVAVESRNLGQPPVRAACQAQAAACQAARRGQPSFERRCARGPARCALTVGELERCLFDLSYNMYFLLLTAPMCDDICRTVDPLSVDAASCATVRATCPDLAFTRPRFPALEEAVAPCGR